MPTYWKEALMSKILIGFALLATLALVQPAAAQTTTPAVSAPASPSQVQALELSEFLASLGADAPQNASDIGNQNHCVPSTWCEDLKAECAMDCAPCGVNYAICYHYICDIFCSCKAC
jgi:hypothetical protein